MLKYRTATSIPRIRIINVKMKGTETGIMVHKIF